MNALSSQREHSDSEAAAGCEVEAETIGTADKMQSLLLARTPHLKIPSELRALFLLNDAASSQTKRLAMATS